MMDAKDFIELVIKHGWPVIIALAAYRIVNLVFDWLSQAEHVGMLKVLFNRRRQHLEKCWRFPIYREKCETWLPQCQDRCHPYQKL